MGRNYTQSSASRPIPIMKRRMSGTVVPPRQQASQLRRGNTETSCTFQNPVAHTTARPRLQSLYPVNEVQDYSPADYLSQSPELTSTPCVSVTLSPTLERGELQTQDFSYLSTSSRSDFTWPMSYSSSPPTSDAGLTIASTATSSAMSRSNTDDVLSGTIGMLRVDSSASHCNYSVASDSTIVDAYKVDDVAAQSFPQSSFSNLDENSVVSQSQTSLFDHQSFVSFPSQTEMKRLPSEESNASSLSSSSQRSQSRMSRRVSEQNAQSKARPLAPKKECHDDSSSAKAKTPKIVDVTSDDGTVRQKAEIPRTTRQQPQRKTTFCQICDDHPQGFHGEHELRRHIERHHTTFRKVWICKDNTLTDGRRPAVPLTNCKACRNHKTYGANYNAAAHLRRAHFFPCKNKRGGRGKVSEGRGGMGGGEEPPMDELKNWMYEKVEVNVAGNSLPNASPELSQIDNDIFTEFNQFDDAASYNHLTVGIPQEPANSYDWNGIQFPVDLVNESIQFINSGGNGIDENFLLPSLQPQTLITSYPH
jgi:hypothetical protein